MISSILLSALSLPALGGSTGGEINTVPWYEGSFDQALEAAAENDSAVFLYCWSQQSESCSKFQERTLADEAAIASLQDYLCVGANVASTEGRALIDHYGVQTLPTMLIILPDGKAEDGILGLAEPASFVHEMERIARGEGTVTQLAAAAHKMRKGKDMEAAVEANFKLLGKLTDVGRGEEAAAAKQQIFNLDPKGKTLTSARVRMWDAMEASYAPMHAEGTSEEVAPDFAVLQKFAKKTKHGELRFEARAWMAEQHYYREEHDAARASIMLAWQDVPGEYMMDYGAKVGHMMHEAKDELSSKERKFAAKLAAQIESGIDAHLASIAEKRDACACEESSECCGNDEEFDVYAQQLRGELLQAARTAYLAAGDADSAERCNALAAAEPSAL